MTRITKRTRASSSAPRKGMKLRTQARAGGISTIFDDDWWRRKGLL